MIVVKKRRGESERKRKGERESGREKQKIKERKRGNRVAKGLKDLVCSAG